MDPKKRTKNPTVLVLFFFHSRYHFREKFGERIQCKRLSIIGCAQCTGLDLISSSLLLENYSYCSLNGTFPTYTSPFFY